MAVGHRGVVTAKRGFFVGDMLHGFMVLFAAGLHLFNRTEFFGKLKMPVVANLITFVALFAASWFGLYALFDWLLQADWGFLDFLRDVIRILGSLVLTLITLFFLAPAVIETVTGPFLDGLADATEKAMAGESIQAVDLGTWRNALLGVRSTAQVLVIQLVVLIPCLILAWVLPLFGLLIVYAIAAALTSLIWFEIPFLRRGQGLRQRVRVLRHNWARALGFGMAFQLGMLVPFFNMFLLTPAAAVAASMLYFHFEKAPPSR
jgi:uncharacterized protein involved in cysteine biosynthesis